MIPLLDESLCIKTGLLGYENLLIELLHLREKFDQVDG
jgi:hypothetical protein